MHFRIGGEAVVEIDVRHDCSMCDSVMMALIENAKVLE